MGLTSRGFVSMIHPSPFHKRISYICIRLWDSNFFFEESFRTECYVIDTWASDECGLLKLTKYLPFRVPTDYYYQTSSPSSFPSSTAPRVNINSVYCQCLPYHFSTAYGPSLHPNLACHALHFHTTIMGGRGGGGGEVGWLSWGG